jgi:hypothetical protein
VPRWLGWLPGRPMPSAGPPEAGTGGTSGLAASADAPGKSVLAG